MDCENPYTLKPVWKPHSAIGIFAKPTFNGGTIDASLDGNRGQHLILHFDFYSKKVFQVTHSL